MRERNREELPKPVDLKPLRPEISGLMRAIRNTVKPVINTQMSSHSKSRLVELINVQMGLSSNSRDRIIIPSRDLGFCREWRARASELCSEY